MYKIRKALCYPFFIIFANIIFEHKTFHLRDKTFTIHTLGCKLNFSESSDLARQLKEVGFTQDDAPANIIVNSCAVTAAAVKKGRNLTARLHREFPDAQIILMGCYAALQPVLLKQWSGVSAVFGSEDKMNVISYLLGEPLPQTPDFFPAYSSGDRTRSFLKIQDGCDNHCSYCTVAIARGKSRSNTIEGVLQQFQELSDLGIKEVNLTGVNIGDFGKQQGVTFLDLLREIEAMQPVERVRISSIEPNLLDEKTIALMVQSRMLMPHFHLPLQSGTDRVLALMRRKYKRSLFEEKVLKIKEHIPDACIAVDIISGFPTESEEDFEDTFRFVERLPISYLHVFTYSVRPNTPAATMPQLHDTLKKERTKQLLKLSEEKKEAFYNSYIGQTRPVLFESDIDNGYMYGFTDNYIKIKHPYQEALVNQIVDVVLKREEMILGEE